MLLSHRNQTPFHIIDYLFHVLPDVKVFPVSSVLHFFPHSSSSLITSESILFFPSLPPFPKVSLFTPLSQVLSTQVIFFFPSWETSLAVPFHSFLQITSFYLLLPLIMNAVWKSAPFSFPQYEFCSLNHAMDFPLFAALNFPIALSHPLLFPSPHFFSLAICFPFSNLLNFTHVTFLPQFGDLNSHTVPTLANLLGKYLGY